MKTLMTRLNFFSRLTALKSAAAIVGILISFGFLNPTHADLMEKIPPLKIENVAPYKSQYIKIFYVVGRSQILDQPFIMNYLQIKEIQTKKIEDSMESVLFPSVNLIKTALFVTYNFVVVVVTSNPKFTIYNSDGLTPAPGQFEIQPFETPIATAVVTKMEIRKAVNRLSPEDNFIIRLPDLKPETK